MNKRRGIFLFRWISWISEASGYISGIAILLASLAIFEEVLFRYFFKWPSIWQVELSIYLLMITAFIGGAYGLKHNAHVGVDLVIIRLPEKVQLIVKTVTSFLCMILTVVIAWKAWEMWWEATSKGWHSDSLWGPPLTYPYLTLPVGMSLITLQYVVIIFENLQALFNPVVQTPPGDGFSHEDRGVVK
jgi:TRAP-type C4-dicarboxylate transport system permease small subunit